MSTPFTDPSSEATFQALLDEIVENFDERRRACELDAYTPEEGRDVQYYSFWRVFQEWLEVVLCVKYIDHINGPWNEAGDDFLYYTLATFREVAGLHADGFRRATYWDGVNDPTWSYGRIQAGDIIGPWIFEDLQKALSALRWCLHGAQFDDGPWKTGFGGLEASASGSNDDPDDQTTAENAAWAQFAAKTSPARGITFAGAFFQIYWAGGLFWDADCGMRVVKPLEDIDNDIPFHEKILYGYFNARGSTPDTFNTFGNPYTQGWNALTAGVEIPPVQITTPQWPDGSVTTNHGFFLDWTRKAQWLVKWNFTNQND